MFGSRKCNVIHTRLRHQCSSLGADLFRANMVNDPSCPCGCPLEDAIHYLLECPFHTNARKQLFMNITPYTVISIETLLFGSDNLTEVVCSLIVVYIIVNKILQLANNFIIKSNRKIVERGEIESLNTHIHDAHFPGLQQKH